MFSNDRQKKIFLVFIVVFLATNLSSCNWQKCRATGKMMLASVSKKDGKLERSTEIFYPSVEIVNDMNPPMLNMVNYIQAMPYQKSFEKDLKSIDKDLANIKPIEITNNLFISQIDRTNVVEINYHHNDANHSIKILDLVMKKLIEIDIESTRSAIERNNELINSIPVMLKEKQISESTNPTDKGQKEIENLKLSLQKVKTAQIYLKSVDEYLSHIPEEDKTNSVNYKIVESADSSCSALGYFNFRSLYIYLKYHLRYSVFR